MNILLLGTYELGRQPFGLASPAAGLRRRGHHVVCCDLAVEALPEPAVAAADLVAFYVPMHTATRLACELVEPIRAINPRAKLCFYGLYAPLNASHLRQLGADFVLGGEFESLLLELADRLAAGEPTEVFNERISLERQAFDVPDRSDLPPLARYAQLVLPSGERRLVGYTEASRGCKHRCRHCPVVPVYQGRFRIVAPEVVLEDIRRQVAAGAQHITFGDPDFLNGPRHALRVVRLLHATFPQLTYDITAKIEHLLRYAEWLPVLRDTGCLFVTTAVESLDDEVLARLEKGHRRADFFAVVEQFRQHGMVLHPTFIPFTPWTTLEGYQELLGVLEQLDLVDHVSPVQLTMRLLIPAGSRLLELEEIRRLVGSFDPVNLIYPWRHPDERVDRLQKRIEELVATGSAQGLSRRALFYRIRQLAGASGGLGVGSQRSEQPARCTVPYLTEPWYC